MRILRAFQDYADYVFFFHFANGSLQAAVTRNLFFNMVQLPADNPWLGIVAQQADGMFSILNDRLGKAKWLAGDNFTAADIMCTYSATTNRVFVPRDLGPYPNVLRWLKDIGERPAYKEAMKKGEPGWEPALGAQSPPMFAALKDIM